MNLPHETRPARPVQTSLEYMPQLDALRAFAVLAVVIHHSPLARLIPLSLGGMGVRLFFVLSGYLITDILLHSRADSPIAPPESRWDSLWRFYVRRFLRIFPLYYFVVLFAFLVDYGSARSLIIWLLSYTLNVQMSLTGEWNEFSHFWSLAVEGHFYVVWPWLVLFTSRRWLTTSALLIILTGPAYRFYAVSHGLNSIATSCFTLSCLDTLGIGALLAMVCQSGIRRARLDRVMNWAVLPAGIATLTGLVVFYSEQWRSVFFDLGLALCYSWLVYRAARRFSGTMGRLLEARPLVFIGKISYGIYVYHVFVPALVISILRSFGRNLEERYAIIVLLALVTDIGIPAMSWYFLEMPISQLKRYFTSHPTSRDASPFPVQARRSLALIAGIFCLLLVRDAGLRTKGWITRHQIEHRMAGTPGLRPPRDCYVSPTGDDHADGKSETTPWRTLHAISQCRLVPGDHIFLQGGQSFPGPLLLGRDDWGTPKQPIVVDSYGQGRATIRAGDGDGIALENTMGVDIRNLVIVGSGALTNHGSGIHASNTLTGDVTLPFLHVDQVEVTGFGGCGILIAADNGKSGYRDVRITHANVHNNAVCGIQVRGSFVRHSVGYAHAGVYIGFSSVWKTSGISGETIKHTGAGIILTDVNGGMIERCASFENGALCNKRDGGSVGIQVWDSNEITLQHNESWRNRTAGTKGGGGFNLDGGVTHSVVRCNYSHDNDGAGFSLMQFPGSRPFDHNWIHHNISENDGRKNDYGAIHVWGEVRSTAIYNNTIYVASAPQGKPSAICFVDDEKTPKAIHVCNNILMGAGGVALAWIPSAKHDVLFHGNNYFSEDAKLQIIWCGMTYRSLEAWRDATGQERLGTVATGLSVDPRLWAPGKGGTVDDAQLLETLRAYRLRGDSPLIHAGVNLPFRGPGDGGLGDFFGNRIPQDGSFAIGAHEARPTRDSPEDGLLGNTP